MTNYALFLRFGVALLIGTLIGLQREYAYGDPEKELFAGARTFALMALFGAIGAFAADVLGSPWVFIGLSLVLGGLLGLAYFIEASKYEETGQTTEVAALVTVIVGAICYAHSIEVAAALGVVTTVLLAVKWEMRSLVRVITREDVYATLRFAVITAIILPILPDQTYGPPPVNVINPHNVWRMVVFISGINFLGYLLIKIVGPRRGVGISGFLGGLASSTANTLSFSQRSQEDKELTRPYAAAIIIGWTVMFGRVLFEVAVINRALLNLLWPAILLMGGAALLYSLYLYLSQKVIDEEELELSNPFELWPAIKFGLLFALVLVISKTAQLYLGTRGLYVTSFLSGLADVDAITLSLADLSSTNNGVDLEMAKTSIVLASIANTIVKGGMVITLGTKRLRRLVWPGFVLIVGIGMIAVLFF
jgi:uncharacterized membrane protein (DUF4010 family)